jgi:hypothetical protein
MRESLEELVREFLSRMHMPCPTPKQRAHSLRETLAAIEAVLARFNCN